MKERKQVITVNIHNPTVTGVQRGLNDTICVRLGNGNEYHGEVTLFINPVQWKAMSLAIDSYFGDTKHHGVDTYAKRRGIDRGRAIMELVEMALSHGLDMGLSK